LAAAGVGVETDAFAAGEGLTGSPLEVFVRVRGSWLHWVLFAVVVVLASVLALASSPELSGTVAEDGLSDAVAMSGDGRLVGFVSSGELFVYDRGSRTLHRSDVGHHLFLSTPVAFSPDLRFVAFTSIRRSSSHAADCSDVFVYDRPTGKTEQVDLTRKGAPGAPGEKGNCAWGVALSPDGRFVAFDSASPNLVAGATAHTSCPDEFSGCWGWDVFVRDRATGTTERVSVSIGGEQANGDSTVVAISPDGRLVYFDSDATNLTADGKTGGLFVHDRLTKATKRVPITSPLVFSQDARFAAFSVQDNRDSWQVPVLSADLYVYAQATGKRTLVRVTKSGNHANGALTPISISADGRYVVFLSDASNLAAPSAHARCENETPNGRGSQAGNGNCPDIYLTDRSTGKTVLVTASPEGKPANDNGNFDYQPAFASADGRYVAFTSTSTNLVPRPQATQSTDVFLRDLKTHTTTPISAAR
jgi:Tol biopolymer transport system component